MTEFRRLKMKIGEAEFEADVPENEVHPMYCQFLSMLERRSQLPTQLPTRIPTQIPLGLFGADGTEPNSDQHEPVFATTARDGSALEFHGETFDQASLRRIFDLRQDGAVTLKVLPTGPDTHADAMLLILYGYYRLRNETYVLATRLFRSAEQSGIPLPRATNEYVRNSRFVIRGGQRKGSHYALSSQGLAMAQEIAARIAG
jgi:hypothetical protein